MITWEDSVLGMVIGLGDSLRVEYQRRRSVGENCRAVEKLRHTASGFELLDHYFLLSDELG